MSPPPPALLHFKYGEPRCSEPSPTSHYLACVPYPSPLFIKSRRYSSNPPFSRVFSFSGDVESPSPSRLVAAAASDEKVPLPSSTPPIVCRRRAPPPGSAAVVRFRYGSTVVVTSPLS